MIMKRISLLSLGLLCGLMGLLCGCSEFNKLFSPNFVYQRSIAELNQKAAVLLQQGDTQGAISRLEAAFDLDPKEPNTLYNLGVAYQNNASQADKAEVNKAQINKAIVAFEQLLTLNSPVPRAKILQSLAVCYETKADQLLGKTPGISSEDAASEGKKQNTAEAAANQSEALTYYQKALDTLGELQKLQPDDMIQIHMNTLKTEITKLQGEAQ